MEGGREKMNLEQIVCHVLTLGKHVEFEWNSPHFDVTKDYGDHHCSECGYYLYTICDAKICLQHLRNSGKMWWETLE